MAYIKNLNFSVNSFNLSIPYLEIKEGAVNVLTGPSGAGKTTLFNLISGLIPHHDWIFNVDGVDLSKLSIEERRLGIVFQNHELFPHLTAKENVEIVMKSRNNNSPEAMVLLKEYVKILNLESCWHTKAQALSGGEKQRVSILRAIVSEPRILLLDEPFSALDIQTRDETRAMVKSILDKQKITTLLISHDPYDAEYFGQLLIRLVNGQVVHNS